MAGQLRREVLKAFKDLHKTRKIVFKEDDFALDAARRKINEEFKKNKHVKVADSIQELVKLSVGVEQELRTRVIQAKEKEPGVFELQMRPDVRTEENAKLPTHIKSTGAGKVEIVTEGCQQKSAQKSKT